MSPSSRQLRRGRRVRIAALFLPLLLAACSGASGAPGVATLSSPGSSPSPSASSSMSPEDAQEAFLAYARCMRENGIDMPDPQVNGPMVTIGDPGSGASGSASGGGGLNPQDETFKKADETCKHFLSSIIQEGNGPPALSAEQQEAMLKFAQCMREHGVDMPDPKDNGMAFQIGGGTDPNSGDFKKADEACRGLLADLPSVGAVDGPGSGAGQEIRP